MLVLAVGAVSFAPAARNAVNLGNAAARRHQGAMMSEASSPLDGLVTGYTKFSAAQQEGRGWKQALAEAIAGEYDRESVKDDVTALKDSAPLVVFLWENSPASKKAVRLLRLSGAEPKLVDLDPKSETGNARRAELGRITGRSSVPSIWIAGEYVGGCDDGPTPSAPGIVDMAFAGTLRQKLEAAGAQPTAQVPGVAAATLPSTPPPESVNEEAEYAEAMTSMPEPAAEPEAAPAAAEAAPAAAEPKGKVVPTAVSDPASEEPAAVGVPAGFTDGGIF